MEEEIKKQKKTADIKAYMLEYNKQYREKNREKTREYANDYYKKNRDKVIERISQKTSCDICGQMISIDANQSEKIGRAHV